MWRAPGMLDLAVLSVFGFSGYAALFATAPLWAVNGGATPGRIRIGQRGAAGRHGAGSACVPGPWPAGVRVGCWWPDCCSSVSPAPAYLLSDGLGWVLGLSAVRGLGFGILTVVGSAVVAHLVPAGRRGAAIGVTVTCF